MITQRAVIYAKVLYSMDLKEKSINQAKILISNCKELIEVLGNPIVSKKEKNSVIEALFENEICSFFKVLCENKAIGIFTQIMEAYEDLVLEHKNMLKAKLTYAVKPDDEQIEQIKRMLCEKYNKAEVILEHEKDTSLVGGYVLYVRDMEYNKSIKGALSEMQKTLIGR